MIHFQKPKLKPTNYPQIHPPNSSFANQYTQFKQQLLQTTNQNVVSALDMKTVNHLSGDMDLNGSYEEFSRT